MVNLIVAAGARGEIGIGNKLIEKSAIDLRFFRRKTQGNIVIMGRKTLESINHALPMRQNIVITRDKTFYWPGVYVRYTISEAFEQAKTIAKEGGCEIFVIGGAEIYRQFLEGNLIDRIYLTSIGRFYPEADKFISLPTDWREIERRKEIDNGVDMEFITLERPIVKSPA